ncbi:alpha/beta fold hydrolase [Mangrovicoccus ximenensis]|uniref:alpha/beta fold hydrolase n=1 Tax=Mangrovicoccus ximenensis TaxID=1911570 RepID=UPI000D360A91|nr:alpha/beta fold hydrolase [Mangrovicoccus ximenensis]
MLPPLQHLELGALPLPGGGTLPGAVLTYRAWGRPAPGGGNVVLIPSHYTGTSASPAAMIGPGRALDPDRFCIIAPDLFGNGNATSPSHLGNPTARLGFPQVSIADNVAAQARLLAHLGIDRLRLVYGWSMGAIQAWHWAACGPLPVAAILPVCGATGCWPLNRVFLAGLKKTSERCSRPHLFVRRRFRDLVSCNVQGAAFPTSACFEGPANGRATQRGTGRGRTG